ncbi:MAG: NAD-dependent epimerase/dehydratase family protein [Candidatus Anstonellales archaeon]
MIYITGASGRLGRRLLDVFPKALPLSRKPILGRKGVLTNYSRSQLEKILKKNDVVLHVAGSMDFENEAELRKGNVEITENLAEALPEGKIIYASSIAVYGKKPAEIPADEFTELNPDSAYARAKLEAENIVLNKNSWNAALRIATIYGPEYEDYFKIIKLIDKGRMIIFGNGENRIPFVHVEDVAYAFKLVYEKKAHGIYIISGKAEKQKEIYAYVANALGKKPPWVSMPPDIAKTVAGLVGVKFTQEHFDILSSDRVFDFAKAYNELGFAPRSLWNGIDEMVAVYKNKYKH